MIIFVVVKMDQRTLGTSYEELNPQGRQNYWTWRIFRKPGFLCSCSEYPRAIKNVQNYLFYIISRLYNIWLFHWLQYIEDAATLSYVDGIATHWYDSNHHPSINEFAQTDKKDLLLLATETSNYISDKIHFYVYSNLFIRFLNSLNVCKCRTG